MKINDVLHDLTSDPNKLSAEARNEAARIFRIVLRENGIDAKFFSNALSRWTNRRATTTMSTSDKSKNAHANDRGNFVKAIIKDRISLDRLIMALQVLDPISFSITIGLRFDRRPEKLVRFNYIDDPARYQAVTGKPAPPYFKVLVDTNDPIYPDTPEEAQQTL